MSVPLRIRLLEWFADQSPRVQYPRPVRDADFHWFRWVYPMPWWKRLSMALLFVWVAFVSIAILSVMLLFVGAFIHAVF